MKVKILRLGHAAHHVECAAGTTIGELLEREGIPTQGWGLSLNGLGASTTTVMSDSDCLVCVPKVEGGFR